MKKKKYVFKGLGDGYSDNRLAEVNISNLEIPLEVDQRGVFYITNNKGESFFVVGVYPSDVGYGCWLMGISNTDEFLPLPKGVSVSYENYKLNEWDYNLKMIVEVPEDYEICISRTIEERGLV